MFWDIFREVDTSSMTKFFSYLAGVDDKVASNGSNSWEQSRLANKFDRLKINTRTAQNKFEAR
jgi:hypothetical protein